MSRRSAGYGKGLCTCTQGGFKRWAGEGWGIREGVSDYTTAPVALIGERVGVLADTTGAAL